MAPAPTTDVVPRRDALDVGKQEWDPAVAEEMVRAIGLEPLEPFSGRVSRPWPCRCTQCGKEVAPTFSNVRDGRTQGCSHCRFAKAIKTKQVPEQEAVAVMVAGGLTPLDPYLGSARAPWRCQCMQCGAEVTSSLSKVRAGKGCRSCSLRAAWAYRSPRVSKWNEETASELALQRDLEPLEPFVSLYAPWKLRCTRCGQETNTTLNRLRRTKREVRCVGCKPYGPDTVGALETITLHGLEPLEEYQGAQTPWPCRCLTCGKTLRVRISDLRHGRRKACKYCAGTDLDAEDAIEHMRARDLEPLEPYPGTMFPWRCKCLKCGREVTPRHNGVRRNQGGCAWCAGNKVDPAEAVALMVVAELEPLEPYTSAGGGWKCRCTKCGKVVKPSYSNVRSGHGGCRWCAPAGFDPGRPGSVYLMTHTAYRAWQVGITNVPEQRVAAHERQGWDLVELMEFQDGHEAERLERTILGYWRSQGWPDAVPKDAMPQGGYTETVAWVNVPEVSLQDFLA